MNTHQPSSSGTVLVALVAIVAAAAVLAVLLFGGGWPKWAFYTLIASGLLAATGAIGVLVKALARNGD